MPNKIRILMVLDTLRFGGAEVFNLSVVKNIDRTKYQIDFAITLFTDSEIEREIKALGCGIYLIPKFKGYNSHSYKKQWSIFLREHQYDIVHGHTTGPMSLYLSVAKKMGCVTIAHSHSAFDVGNALEKIAKRIWSIGVKNKADYWLSCSDKAAKRLFGKKYKNSNKYFFVPNGIDVDKFKYSDDYRKEIRNQYHIEENALVIGHIGSLTEAKNHKYLINVFANIYNSTKDSYLLLCGDGPLKEKIMNQVNELGLNKRVVFAGVTSSAHKYYSAMDVFVFPSLFEGLPISLVEAQTSGLVCLYSDLISNDVQISDYAYRKSIKESPKDWADSCLRLINDSRNRDNGFECAKASAFKIENTVKIISSVYDDAIKDKNTGK